MDNYKGRILHDGIVFDSFEAAYEAAFEILRDNNIPMTAVQKVEKRHNNRSREQYRFVVRKGCCYDNEKQKYLPGYLLDLPF